MSLNHAFQCTGHDQVPSPGLKCPGNERVR